MRQPIGLSVPYRKIAPDEKSKWVGLTPTERAEIAMKAEMFMEAVKLTEAALRKKNM